MKITDELIVFTLLFFFMFISLRGFIMGICDYCLKKGERKKIKKGQSFKEWLLYSRFKNVIPKILLYLYYSFIISHFIFDLFILVAIILNKFSNIVHSLTVDIIFIDFGILLILNIAFYTPKRGEYNYGRWIKKRRRCKHK